MARGYRLYPAFDDPHRYAHVYGPLLFLIEGFALCAPGPTVLVSKLAGVTAAAAFAAPFVLPRVDVASYLHWLRYCTRGTLVARSLLSNLG